MAKNRKRKKTVTSTPHSTLKVGITKTQFDKGCSVARKTLQFMGYDPNLFEMFTKKQKLFLIPQDTPMPLVCVRKGHHVPYQYVNNIRTSILNFMRDNYVHEESQLSYLELAMYGLPFLFRLGSLSERGLCTQEQREAFVDRVREDFSKVELTSDINWFFRVYRELSFELTIYSQIYFRTYGFRLEYDVRMSKEFLGLVARIRFELTSKESEHIYFLHKGIKRKAFQVFIGSTEAFDTSGIFVRHSRLFPGSKSSKVYHLYVQSHVIHRFKERVDILDAAPRNHLLNTCFTIAQRVARSVKGGIMMVCSVGNLPLGYFPLTIQEDKVFLLSFLPFVSQITPEGSKLFEILHLSKEELTYLGMDKLSFYFMVDFDRIPVLKNALIESGIWQIKEKLDEIHGNPKDEIDEVKTTFVKNFLLKLEEHKESEEEPSLSQEEIYSNTSEEWN